MKYLMQALLLGLTLSLVGCVAKVTEEKPGAKPGYKDRVETRYQRNVDQVFEASKRALNSYGNVTRASNVLTSTNDVRTVEGYINGQGVYIRIEKVDSKTTSTVIQVRTKLGGTDLRTASEMAQEIVVQLN
jgi:hypothetical protein